MSPTLRPDVLSVHVPSGIQANDFANIIMSTPTAEQPVYAVSGFTFSVAAGRLSYVLGKLR